MNSLAAVVISVVVFRVSPLSLSVQLSQSAAKRLAAREGNVVRYFDVAVPMPFVKPVGQNNASAMLERRAIRGLLRYRLRTSVDHSISYGRVLCPEWHQPPTQHREFAFLAVILSDRRHKLRRCNVVPRLDCQRAVYNRKQSDRTCYSRIPTPFFMRRNDAENRSTTKPKSIV